MLVEPDGEAALLEGFDQRTSDGFEILARVGDEGVSDAVVESQLARSEAAGGSSPGRELLRRAQRSAQLGHGAIVLDRRLTVAELLHLQRRIVVKHGEIAHHAFVVRLEREPALLHRDDGAEGGESAGMIAYGL